MSPAQLNRKSLLALLQDNGGKLGNINARRLLSKQLGDEVSLDEYEQLKEQLLSEGLIRRAPGRGGAIELIESDASQGNISSGETAQNESPEQRIETLCTSLSYLPGLRAKKNKATITILCGEDSDKLYCGWDQQKSAYFVQYRLESGREDHSELAAKLFAKASFNIPGSTIQCLAAATTLYLGTSVAQANLIVRRLMSLLEEVTLDNAPQQAEAPRKPRAKDYYLEIARLVKFCVENNLKWPLKNWRKTLGFDDVDDLIVIGSSPNGAIERYREHVVPAVLIKEESVKLAERGAPAHVIADFIQHHLYIVLISRSEAALLDRVLDEGGLSLKTSMPEGWVLGCDPLDRLKAAGIHVNYSQPVPLPEWKPWKRPRLRDKVRKILNTPVIRV